MFAANPLVLFEGNSNGHNDVLLTVFVAGPCWRCNENRPWLTIARSLRPGQVSHRRLVSLIFIVVALKGKWGWQRIALTVVATAITVVVGEYALLGRRRTGDRATGRAGRVAGDGP